MQLQEPYLYLKLHLFHPCLSGIAFGFQLEEPVNNVSFLTRRYLGTNRPISLFVLLEKQLTWLNLQQRSLQWQRLQCQKIVVNGLTKTTMEGYQMVLSQY